MPPPRNQARLAAAVVGLVALVATARGLSHACDVDPASLARAAAGRWEAHRAESLAWVDAHLAMSAALLFAAVAILPLLMLPVSPLLALCGMALGPWLGTLVAGLGMMVNAFGAYALARRCRPWAARRVAARGFAIPTISDERLPYFIVPMRVIPGMPFVIQNSLLGLADVSWPAFARWVLPLEIPCAAPYVWVGAGIAEGHRRHLLLGGALVLAGVFLAHRFGRRRGPAPTDASRLSGTDCI